MNRAIGPINVFLPPYLPSSLSPLGNCRFTLKYQVYKQSCLARVKCVFTDIFCRSVADVAWSLRIQ